MSVEGQQREVKVHHSPPRHQAVGKEEGEVSASEALLQKTVSQLSSRATAHSNTLDALEEAIHTQIVASEPSVRAYGTGSWPWR